MKIRGLVKHAAALGLALSLSLSLSVPAFASHKLLDKNDYVLQETEDGSTECLSPEGKPMTGWVTDEENNLYYFDSGKMDFGWDKIKGDWYYFDPDTGILATNTTVLNYDVDEDGKMVKIHAW